MDGHGLKLAWCIFEFEREEESEGSDTEFFPHYEDRFVAQPSFKQEVQVNTLNNFGNPLKMTVLSFCIEIVQSVEALAKAQNKRKPSQREQNQFTMQ